MAREEVESRFESLMAALKTTLKQLGYVKQGQKFRRTISGNIALIEIQRSISSDSVSIPLTVNLGIISTRLFDSGRDIKKAGSDHAHMRERLGFLLSDPHDKWWEINGSEDGAVIKEIVDLVTGKAVPFLEVHTSDTGLINLWKTGRSPGLTEGQRLRFLNQLQVPS